MREQRFGTQNSATIIGPKFPITKFGIEAVDEE
jgi:hypothetical protein